MLHQIPIWDWPVRLCHWVMAVLVGVAITSAIIGGNAMQVHGQAGVALCGLLGFRLVWGLVGTRTARFTQFVGGPATVREYLRGNWQGAGHNPLGAWSVLLMLGLLMFQALSGLFTNDDIAFNGPLYKLVDKSLSDAITGVHQAMLWWLAGVIVLHIAAIIFYRVVRKQNLVAPMIRGWNPSPVPMPGNTPVRLAALLIALVVGVACSVVASGVWLPSPASAPAVTPDW